MQKSLEGDRMMKGPIKLLKSVWNRVFYYCAPAKVYLNKRFKATFNRNINWKNPSTYNEKLQWLKVYYRDPLLTRLVDKYEVRQFIAEKIGSQYLIPLLGVWDRVEDIDFDKLPNQFVLKCTHDSGSVVICKDREKFDIKKAKDKLGRGLKRNFYYNHREWPYKNIKSRIIAEAYMEDESGYELKDYKFFAFNGKVKALFVAQDRLRIGEEVKFDFFDEEFNHLPIKHGHDNAAVPAAKPEKYEEMVRLAEVLAGNFPHVRVDFYNIKGRIYFGELTFYHHSGFVPFQPAEWDKIFGDWLILPQKR